MTSHTDPAAPRSTARRLLWVAWLAAVVLTSLGHGGSSNPLDYLQDPKIPPEPACVAGSSRIVPTGLDQVGRAGAPLGQSLVLTFLCTSDQSGEAMSAPLPADLLWEVTSGGGTINGAATVRNFFRSPKGYLASLVNWTLGADSVGTQVVTATVDGRVFTFQATALPAGDGSGQCSDPAELNGTQFEAAHVIEGPEVWTLAGSPYRGDAVFVGELGRLRIEPGVRVCLNTLSTLGQLLAIGTAAQPIRFIGAPPQGLRLLVSGSVGPNTLQQVIGEGVREFFGDAPQLTLEDTQWQALPGDPASSSCNKVTLWTNAAWSTQVKRSVFDGFGGIGAPASSCPALQLRTVAAATGLSSVFMGTVRRAVRTGMEITGSGPGGWLLLGCEVSGSGGHGILVQRPFLLHVLVAPQPDVIRNCSVFGNAGLAVNNPLASDFTVDASFSWWGDPAGPNGPGGDGISAGVDASQALDAPPLVP